LKYIKYSCLIFSEKYILEHYDAIIKYANAIERRDNDDAEYCTREMLLQENLLNLKKCKETNCEYILINDNYDVDMAL